MRLMPSSQSELSPNAKALGLYSSLFAAGFEPSAGEAGRRPRRERGSRVLGIFRVKQKNA